MAAKCEFPERVATPTAHIRVSGVEIISDGDLNMTFVTYNEQGEVTEVATTFFDDSSRGRMNVISLEQQVEVYKNLAKTKFY